MRNLKIITLRILEARNIKPVPERGSPALKSFGKIINKLFRKNMKKNLEIFNEHDIIENSTLVILN